MIKLTTLPLAAAVLLAFACPALAQPEFIKTNVKEMVQKVGLHLNTSFREPHDPNVSKGTTLGVSLGLSPGKSNGWKFPFGLTTFSENLHGPSGRPFAELSARGILAGIGYGWHWGRLATGANLQAGFALYRTTAIGDQLAAFEVPSGVVSVRAGNAPLLRPQLKAEYFITPKFTIRIAADYLFTRPDITVTTPTRVITNHWDASNAHANVGFGVYPFRK